jgi:hypothetical protein
MLVGPAKVVVALDFGTAQSGAAYALRDNPERVGMVPIRSRFADVDGLPALAANPTNNLTEGRSKVPTIVLLRKSLPKTDPKLPSTTAATATTAAAAGAGPKPDHKPSDATAAAGTGQAQTAIPRPAAATATTLTTAASTATTTTAAAMASTATSRTTAAAAESEHDGYSLVAFGMEAADLYHSILASNASAIRDGYEYLLLRRFKMQLLGDGTGALPEVVYADCGRKVPLLVALRETLRGLGESALSYLQQLISKHSTNDQKASADKKSTTDAISAFTASDIDWVITTPTLWNERAKCLMRNAAAAANLWRSQIVLESEAASFVCAHKLTATALWALSAAHDGKSWPGGPANGAHNVESNDAGSRLSSVPVPSDAIKTIKTVKTIKTGDWLIVLDGGGGTFDVTYGQLSDGGKLQNVRWDGIAKGGCEVDEAFMAKMRSIFGANFLDQYEAKHPADFARLRANLELLKHRVTADPNSHAESATRTVSPAATIAPPASASSANPASAVVSSVPSPSDSDAGAEQDLILELEATFISEVELFAKLCVGGKKKGLATPNGGRLRLDADRTGTCARFASACPPPPETPIAANGSNNNDVRGLASPDVTNIDASRKDVQLKSVAEFDVLSCGPMYVKYSGGVLRFSPALSRSLMNEVISPIHDHMSKLGDRFLQASDDVAPAAIFAVGGFCESPLLQSTLQSCINRGAFGAKCNVKLEIPPRPMEAVLTGAVLFGLNPRLIESRVLSRAYCVGWTFRWDSSQHPFVDKVCQIDSGSGRNRLDSICTATHCRWLAETDKPVSPNQAFRLKVVPSVAMQEEIHTEFYCTKPGVAAFGYRKPEIVSSTTHDFLGTIVVKLAPTDEPPDYCRKCRYFRSKCDCANQAPICQGRHGMKLVDINEGYYQRPSSVTCYRCKSRCDLCRSIWECCGSACWAKYLCMSCGDQECNEARTRGLNHEEVQSLKDVDKALLGLDRRVTIDVRFGTQIEVTATELTSNKCVAAYISFPQ